MTYHLSCHKALGVRHNLIYGPSNLSAGFRQNRSNADAGRRLVTLASSAEVKDCMNGMLSWSCMSLTLDPKDMNMVCSTRTGGSSLSMRAQTASLLPPQLKNLAESKKLI